MDLTDAYENGAYIPGAADYPPRWQAAASAFRESLGQRAELDLVYGPKPRNRLDLFRPAGQSAGLVVFVHGGYWRRFDKSSWSHFAHGALERGWAVAMPSYTLAPEARIAQITQEMSHAVAKAAAEVAGPVVITGHSAGGHLTARMRSAGVLPEAALHRVTKLVPISPLSDLRPLMQTDMNSDLRIDADEAAQESPLLSRDLHKIATHVWVGGDERPSFLDQARWLSEAWGCDLTVAPGRHHFDVIDALADPASSLVETLLS